MILKSSSLKHSFKNSLKGLKVITVLSVSSILLTNCIIASDLNAITKIPTSSTIHYAPTRQVPAGYVKGNYKAVSLKSVSAKQIYSPAANELSLQEAAEIAAQELFRLYNVNLTNQTLNMYYTPKNDKHPSSWSIHLNVTPDYIFIVDLDATTGEITSLMCQGGPDIEKGSASEDSKTIKNGMAQAEKGLANPNEACNKMKTLLTQKGFISEPIESIKYNSSIYGTACAVAHPYSYISHSFTVTTTSKKTYTICTTQDLNTIIGLFVDTQ